MFYNGAVRKRLIGVQINENPEIDPLGVSSGMESPATCWFLISCMSNRMIPTGLSNFRGRCIRHPCIR